jgi:lysozyme family protein
MRTVDAQVGGAPLSLIRSLALAPEVTMPSVSFTRNLQRHYAELYATCELGEKRFDQVDTLCRQVLADRSRYERVGADTGVPWFVIAAIHTLEAGRRFDRHLHNGDPLSARTRRVPAGRPLTGEPPFSWEESAWDALVMHRLDKVREWTLPRILYELEKYNGWGYRLYHPHVCTPYLWGYSSHYTSGKYIADGTWSDTAVSRQCGAAVLIRRLEEMGEIAPLTREEAPGPLLYYADYAIERGEDLQRFLNTFDGISLRVDGWPGERTSDAVEKVFGRRLTGDPRR